MACIGFQPSHAYLPGGNERHGEGAFDHIRDTARSGMSIEALAESDAFQVGLKFIETGYFWEAHEVLEPVWMALEEASEERYFVQGLIQIANGFLKLRMGKLKAARRLADIALDLVNRGNSEFIMGLPREKICNQIAQLKVEIFLQNNA